MSGVTTVTWDDLENALTIDLSIMNLVDLGVNTSISYTSQHQFVTFNSYLPDGSPTLLFCAASTTSPYKLWWFIAPIAADIKNYVAAASFTDYNDRAFSIVTSNGTDGVLTDTATGLVVSTSLIYGAIFQGRIYKHQFTSNWLDNNGQPYNDTSYAFSQATWCDPFRPETIHGVIAPVTTRLVGNTDNFRSNNDITDIISIIDNSLLINPNSQYEPSFLQFVVILPDGSIGAAFRKVESGAMFMGKWRLGLLKQLN